MSSTIVTTRRATQHRLSYHLTPTRSEPKAITAQPTLELKHSAPPPRDLLIHPLAIRQVPINFVAATNNFSSPGGGPCLRITTTLSHTNEPFSDIFASYREKARREKDILSFWRHDVRGVRRIWPDETPYEVFECGGKQLPGTVKGVGGEEWRVEVRGGMGSEG